MLSILMAATLATSFSGCATVLSGPVSQSQKIKPAPGQPQRQVRVGYLIADFCCGILPLAVDFGTGAIYKPAPDVKK